VLCLEIFKGHLGGLHRLGTRCRLRGVELADLLLQLPFFLLYLELMLGQQLAPPAEHFLPEDEIRLSPGEVCLPPIQGLLLRPKVLLGKGGVTGLGLELLLPLLQPLHSLDLLGPLGFQSLVQGAQLGLVLCRERLPLGHGLLPHGHLLLPPGCLQLPGAHPLEVPLVLLVVPLELGPLGDESSGHRPSALLQLGAPVAEALVLSLKHLPLPQDCCPSVTNDLVGMGQHAREGDWRRFLFGTQPESPPKHHLHHLRSRRGVGARRASCDTPSVESGRGSPSWDLLCRCDTTRRRCRRRRIPGWGMGSRWRCLGSIRGRTADTTLSRFLLLRARPICGPGVWRRRRDLRSRGGRSPGKQTMG
jgi:hypothetical protein